MYNPRFNLVERAETLGRTEKRASGQGGRFLRNDVVRRVRPAWYDALSSLAVLYEPRRAALSL